jgi:hypothetical protein
VTVAKPISTMLVSINAVGLFMVNLPFATHAVEGASAPVKQVTDCN